MSKFLLVPIHLDALCTKDGTNVAQAMVEFNRLPYVSGRRDVNPDTVNLSESIVSQPFQNKNLYLKAGIHLHWALPDALTKESKNGNFPAVPNRWLIIRDNHREKEHWIVESDYLHPPSDGFQEDSVTYPYPDETNQGSPRFRYLGRKQILAEWNNNQSGNNSDAQYLERLTAVGYGEPTFAAFYPNCRSVFGFHDPEYADYHTLPEDLQYYVIGWYSDSKQNYLSEFLKDFQTSFQNDFPGEELTPEIFIDAIEEEFKWKFDNIDNFDEFPEIICYSRLKFSPSQSNSGQSPLESPLEKANIKLAVANTGTEALSAYLAETIDKSKKAIIEEQLEALQFAENLESKKLDTGPRFQEIRHEAGFNAVAGGFLWKIRLETLETQQSSSENKASQTKLDLPEHITSQLNTLNQKQQEYDSALADINSKRRQLFSDWYKYMVCTYPPEDSWDDYPDIDEVKYYIQKRGLEPLQAESNETGTLNLCQDDAGNLSNASGSGSDSSLSSELAGEINSLISAIEAYNQELKDEYDNLNEELKDKSPYPPTYRLEIVGSSRYWEAKEPVVLMVGEDVKASQRHGQDGRFSEDGLLKCEIIVGPTIQDLIQEEFQTILNKINGTKPENDEESIGFSIWKNQPWNPILLEWLVELFTVADGSNKTSANRKYRNDFLTKNYSLKVDDVDLSPKSGQSVVNDTAADRIKTDQDSNIYSGFSILTPYANSLLQKRIKEYLDKHDYEGRETTITNPIYQKISDYEQHLQNENPRDQEVESYLRQYVSQKYPKYQEVVEIDGNQYLGQLANITTLKQWYEDNNLDIIPNPVFTAEKAQALLQKLNCLSQSLGGFNEALLMHKQTLQLPIEDPIGFADYQSFTREIEEAVAGEIKSAPQPLDDFNPIRSGEMRIIDLQLVDTFGQVRNLDWKVNSEEYVIKPESMKANKNNRILLTPRFVQPCRINFRWLSANDQDNLETNDAPNTTPICGWILPNNLNGSLMIYDNQGQALGAININGEWDNAPGNTQLDTRMIGGHEIPNISNIHLHKMVKTMITLGINFVRNFNRCLNNALNNIDPENFAQNQSLALLMGRPIAVVRTSVNLELQGLAAINQDWHIFRQEMQQMCSIEERDTDDLKDVKVPIRIGEYQQLNDGIIGYWKEQENAASETGYEYENNIFYAQQSDLNESENIETQFIDRETNPEVEEGPINIIQSINSSPQTLTMLVDPRGVFHATSGILPSKVINIPPEHYNEALANIKVTFLTAPILTEQTKQGSINLPLPTEPDYDWVWLEKKGRENWSEILTIPVIEKTAFIESYNSNKESEENPEPEEVWQKLLDQEWLRGLLFTENQAIIVSKDKRKTLTGDLENLDDLVNNIFDLSEIIINSVSSQATFSGSQEIREGWLVLSNTPNYSHSDSD